MKPDFDTAIQEHFAAISNRDIEAFKSHLTKSDTLYTIVQNGHAFTTPDETIELHRQWFSDPDWVWAGSVVHKVVGEDVAMALIKYHYRPKAEDQPIVTWLTYVFQLQEGQWRIVHDQNTALILLRLPGWRVLKSSEIAQPGVAERSAQSAQFKP